MNGSLLKRIYDGDQAEEARRTRQIAYVDLYWAIQREGGGTDSLVSVTQSVLDDLVTTMTQEDPFAVAELLSERELEFAQEYPYRYKHGDW